MTLDPLYVLLGEVSVQVLCPFFKLNCLSSWVESCEFFLYILEMKPLSKVSLANIFSHTVGGSLFILLMFSLAVQKLFNLIKFHLFILSFISLALGDRLVKILLHGISEVFLPMFSSRTFMVSWLIFKSFILDEETKESRADLPYLCYTPRNWSPFSCLFCVFIYLAVFRRHETLKHSENFSECTHIFTQWCWMNIFVHL